MILIKVGGSLIDWPEFPGRLRAFLNSKQGNQLVLVVGGGRAADWVRDLDRIHALGEERSHALAVRSLDLTAWVVAALVPGLRVVESVAEMEDCWADKLVPVLAPRLLLEQDDRESLSPLSHTWDVTTDSIAARLAERLGAEELIQLKSADLTPGTDRLAASRMGLVDPSFPQSSSRIPRVTFVNLKEGV